MINTTSAKKTSFHPSKEGFKGKKVGESRCPKSRFHPSKEGFKAVRSSGLGTDCLVSIPLRKVSRAARAPPGLGRPSGFHPSKEGFKATTTTTTTITKKKKSFHPSKEGFKAA